MSFHFLLYKLISSLSFSLCLKEPFFPLFLKKNLFQSVFCSQEGLSPPAALALGVQSSRCHYSQGSRTRGMFDPLTFPREPPLGHRQKSARPKVGVHLHLTTRQCHTEMAGTSSAAQSAVSWLWTNPGGVCDISACRSVNICGNYWRKLFQMSYLVSFSTFMRLSPDKNCRDCVSVRWAACAGTHMQCHCLSLFC